MRDGIDDCAGPNPSTLETRDHLPTGVKPMMLRVTYTDSKLSDYVGLKHSDGQLCIELGPPLFGIVSKAGNLNNLKNELKEAIAAIGIGGLLTHFSDTVFEYVRELLPQLTLPETAGLGAVAWALKKLWQKGKLILGYIHHASIDELPSWMGMIDEAKKNSDIIADSG